MKTITYLMVLFASSAQLNDIEPRRTAVERVYASVLSHRWAAVGVGWQKLEKSELPEEFNSPLVSNNEFVSGFRLQDSDTLVIFTFAHPKYLSEAGFCRSRVSVLILYAYDFHQELAKQKSTALKFMELITFREQDLARSCAATSIRDLESYTFVEATLSDHELSRLANKFRSLLGASATSGCHLSRGAELDEINVTLAGAGGVHNSYQLLVSDGDETISILLKSSDLSEVSCLEGLSD